MNIFKNSKPKDTGTKNTPKPVVVKSNKNSVTRTEKAPIQSLNEGNILIAGGNIIDLEASERFRMLRAHLERQNLAVNKTDIMAVTSAVPSEGKSIVSTNLARAFAGDPKGKTILIDCDLRKPNVHRFFAESSSPGLSDLLVAGKSLGSVLRQVEPGLDMITAGSPVVDSTRTIESPGLSLLLAELKKSYQHIILDCPPVLMCSEVLSIAQLASGSLLVARAWRTERQLVQEAVELLINHDLVGVILNECSDTLTHYGYYGYYGYMGKSKSGDNPKDKQSRFSKLLNR